MSNLINYITAVILSSQVSLLVILNEKNGCQTFCTVTYFLTRRFVHGVS